MPARNITGDDYINFINAGILAGPSNFEILTGFLKRKNPVLFIGKFLIPFFDAIDNYQDKG